MFFSCTSINHLQNIFSSDLLRSEAILTENEMIERIQLKHEWAVLKRKEHVAEMYALQRIVNAQEQALDALQETSPELYEEALLVTF